MSGGIRFVGNFDIASEGKFLWEVLCQLRKFGVGRIVTKNEWARKWPGQPSYMKVVKVQPTMDRWLFGGKVWAEWVYRGQNLGIYEFSKDLNRSDWRLIHKHEEETFAKSKTPMKEVVFPDSMPIPPLQVHFMKMNALKNKESVENVPLRTSLSLCVDPELEMAKKFFVQKPVANPGKSVYEEADKSSLLDLYGSEIPVKVESWNVGPAKFTPKFSNVDMKVKEQSST
ncbi:unnamed protein product [Auanema sp. JU1783]|nr:unnamed protein product [Auanema sp. JU1783]